MPRVRKNGGSEEYPFFSFHRFIEEVFVVYAIAIYVLINLLSRLTIQLMMSRHLHCPISAWIERSVARTDGRDSDSIKDKRGF